MKQFDDPLKPRLLAGLCVAAFLIFSSGNILNTSPTSDETTHLAAGWSYLKTGDFRLNPEHPPLLKSVAALPMLLMRVWPQKLVDDGSPEARCLLDEWET